jgi:DNA-binding transcriptional ArsR family regulator
MSAYFQAAAIMKALAHPMRLQILQVLRQDEACVCHLEAVLGERQATISQHLSRLREAGLVVDQRDGMNVYYSLSDPSLAELIDAVVAMTVRLAQAAPDAFELAGPALHATEICPCPRCREERQPKVETSMS